MFDLGALFGRPPSREKFAQLMQASLRQAKPELAFEFDAEAFSLRNAGGHTLNLHNIHAEYCKAPRAARAQMLERFIAGTTNTTIPHAFADARPHLLPVLRQLPGLDLVRVEHHGVGPDVRSLESLFNFQPFAADLGIALAYDTPNAMAQVGSEELERWGLSLPEALALAEDNLRLLQPPRFVEAAPGLFVSQYGDYYDAARLLLPEVARQVVPHGDPVAMAPNRSHLLLASSRDGAAIERMVAAAEEILAQPRRLSAALFRLQDRQWQLWQPTDEPAATMLHNLQANMLLADYEDQGAALAKALEKSGKDIFIARWMLARPPSSPRAVSLTTVAEGVHAWLPRADLVAVQAPGEEVADSLLVRWDDFERVAGGLLQPLSTRPPRFEYQGDMEAGHFEQLRAVVTTLDAAGLAVPA